MKVAPIVIRLIFERKFFFEFVFWFMHFCMFWWLPWPGSERTLVVWVDTGYSEWICCFSNPGGFSWYEVVNYSIIRLRRRKTWTTSHLKLQAERNLHEDLRSSFSLYSIPWSLYLYLCGYHYLIDRLRFKARDQKEGGSVACGSWSWWYPSIFYS